MKYTEIKCKNAKISEFRRKVAEVEAENAKLRQIIEEMLYMINDVKAKNTEFKARLPIVEQNSMMVNG